MSSVYSGMEPGLMVCIDGYTDADSGEVVSQCLPFNPFYLAFTHEKFCWAIVLCEKGKAPDALRPRRVYQNDNATAIEMIEGLGGYPEEVMQSSMQWSVSSSQYIDWYDYHDVTTYDKDGNIIDQYYIYEWTYVAIPVSIPCSITFLVPFEYIVWDDGGPQIIEDVFPAGSVGNVKSFTLTANAGTYSGTSRYPPPPPRTLTSTARMVGAGRY